MAGVIWDGTDLESSYGFTLKPDGFPYPRPKVRLLTVDVPGRDGPVIVGRKLEGWEIKIVGYVQDTSYAGVLSKITGLDGLFLGVYAAHPDQSGFASPSVSPKTLEIPDMGLDYARCYCIDFWPKHYQRRRLATHAEIEISFFQEISQMTT